MPVRSVSGPWRTVPRAIHASPSSVATEVLPPKLDKLRRRAELARAREAEARSEAEKLEAKLQRRAARLGVDLPAAATAPRVSPASAPPSGIAAIRLVIADEPSRVWSAADIQACLEARGWISTTAVHRRQGIEAAISRLVRGGELHRVARGRYRVDREPG